MEKTLIVSGIWIFCILLAGAMANAAISDGLVSYFPFDVNADDVISGNDGTVVGATLNNTNYKMGTGSYYFDGTGDNITLANPNNFNWTEYNSWTIAAWVNITNNATDRAIWGKTDTAPKGFSGWHNDQNNWENMLSTNLANLFYRVANNTLKINTWQHVVWRYNGTGNANGLSIYINGSRADNHTASSGTLSGITNTYPFVIGNARSINGFIGYIDEFAIFNRSLTESEIEYLYNYGTGAYPYNTSNLFHIYFRDEDTNASKSGITVYLEVVSDDYSTNTSTTTGAITNINLPAGEYRFKYWAIEHPSRFYYITLTNESTSTLYFAMKNGTVTQNVTFTITDEINSVVEGAYIYVLKYNSISNVYHLVNMVKTNFDGQAVSPIELNNQFYKFYVYYDNDLKLVTQPALIYETAVSLQINLGGTIGTKYYQGESVTISVLNFSNATNNFRLDYIDVNNVASTICLEVFKMNSLNNNIPYNSSCSALDAASLLVGVEAINGTTYVGEAYLYASDKYFLDGTSYTFFQINGLGYLGLFMVLVISLIMVFLTRTKMQLMIILTPLPMMIASIFGVIPINMIIAISIEVGAVIVALSLDE